MWLTYCRVYLKSPLLEQNVIFVDIPGGADSNHFRRDNADRYLQSCQMTIVVAKLTRMITDSIFSQQYLEAYRRRRTGSVILVGTFTDVRNLQFSIEKHTNKLLDRKHREYLHIGI